MSEITEEKIRSIVKSTVREMMKTGMLKRADDVAYSETSSRLFEYFRAPERDHQLEAALDKIRDDYYYSIIPNYYGKSYTIDQLAEMYECEISTITRNKKRLCLKLYLMLQ